MKKNMLPLDFVLSFCREMIPEHGEDCFCHSFCDTAGLVGVFDGCGGAGARKHDCYRGYTEAYVASRLCAGAFYDLFRSIDPSNCSARQLTEEVFLPGVKERLAAYSPPKEASGFQIKGSMVRTLPSTAAMAVIQQDLGDDLLVSAIWSGDSRVYVLDGQGLAQLTVDDTTVTDPMENIYEDGILKNILCSDRPVKLHCRTVRLRPPFMVFAATDGCFGYVSTPMEFEGILLITLLQSSSVAQWESNLADSLSGIAGDDHSLCLAAFGYHSFEALQDSLADRYAYLYDHYLMPVSQMPLEDRQSRFLLWESYQPNYNRYLKDGPA